MEKGVKMRRKWVVLAMVLMLTTACGKRPEVTETKPTGSVEQAPETPFVAPTPVKKQEKYFSEGSPSRAIQDLDDMLESYVLNPKTDADRQYNTSLKRHVINGTFDIRELCRLALDKHWGERSGGEQDYFVDLMVRLLEKKAVFSKEQGQKKKGAKVLYKVTYEGDKYLNAEKFQALARSTVHIPSEDLKIELNYKLKRKSPAEGWKIFDVIVDGASLLDNYRYQFDKIISKDGYPTLVHRMESKLKELQEKDVSGSS